MTALVTRDLKVHFGGVKALDGVSLSLRQSGVHAIIGPNGAGKTTFFNLISGAFPADSGEVLLDGTDVSRLGRAELAKVLDHRAARGAASVPYGVDERRQSIAAQTKQNVRGDFRHTLILVAQGRRQVRGRARLHALDERL